MYVYISIYMHIFVYLCMMYVPSLHTYTTVLKLISDINTYIHTYTALKLTKMATQGLSEYSNVYCVYEIRNSLCCTVFCGHSAFRSTYTGSSTTPVLDLETP